MLHNTRIHVVSCLVLCTTLAILHSGCGERGAVFSPAVALPTTDTTPTDTTTTDTTDPTQTDTTPPDTIFTLSTPLTLEWDEPTTYVDDSPLDPTKDIQEYRIYIKTQSGAYAPDNYYPVSAPATNITIRGINSKVNSQAAGAYSFVVTAVDMTNAESYYSNEVNREVN